MTEVSAADAEREFVGCTHTLEALRTIWRCPMTGFVRKHLVAETDSRRVVMWDDTTRLWCTVWSVQPWGGVVQFASRAWLEERMRHQDGGRA